MSLLSPASPRELHDPKDAARALEVLVLKQLFAASGAFKASSIAGGSLHNDLFTEALAEAVAKGGGLGLASQLSLPGTPRPITPHTAPSTPDVVASPHARVTSAFGPREDPFTHERKHHSGVDIAAPQGTPIRAAADGVVKGAGPRGNLGLAVEVVHADGTSTVYAHARALLVAPGDTVRQGQPIAEVGQTGRATGPHLHFEVRRGGHAVSPALALKSYAARVDRGSE